MGKIKSKSIKRAAETLIKEGIEFTDSFEENKKLLEGITPIKKLRNQLAGILVRLKRRSLEKEIGK